MPSLMDTKPTHEDDIDLWNTSENIVIWAVVQ